MIIIISTNLVTNSVSNGSYYVSNIQDYLEYIIKKHETLTYNPPIKIFINKTENRTTFKIKAGY